MDPSEIAEALGTAQVFAFMPDGSILRLEEMKARPPFIVREIDQAGFLEWFRSRAN